MPADNPAHAAEALLLRELGRVHAQHAERVADPALHAMLKQIAGFQARRLSGTYVDLAREPRYADAIAFFKTDLYGDADFSRRDADLARVVPTLVRMLPEGVVATVANAVALNALSHDLDRALNDALPAGRSRIGVADYCRAYRAVGRFDDRERQIVLIGEIGRALERYVKKPMIGAALTMMRGPAKVAGLGALQEFLERGFAAFRRMNGATEFLATISTRELAVHRAIAGGSDAAFQDPGP